MANNSIAEEIRILEAQAAVREQQADDGEAQAPVYYTAGSRLFYDALERADGHRKQARELREEAAQLAAKLRQTIRNR